MNSIVRRRRLVRSKPRISLVAATLFSVAIAACGSDETSNGDDTAPATAEAPPSTEAGSDTTAAPPADTTESTPTTPTGPADEVTLAYGSDTGAFWALTVALAGGYFTDQNLDVEVVLTGGGSETVAALAGGSADFGGIGLGDTMRTFNEGVELTSIALLNQQFGNSIVVSKSAAEKYGVSRDMPIEDRLLGLKGMTIGVPSIAGPGNQVLRFLLHEVGLDPDRDVTVIAVTSSAMLPALQQGQVDAIAMGPPTSTIARDQEGAIVLLDLAQGEVPSIAGAANNVLAVGPGFLDSEKNKDIARRMTAAIAQALEVLNTDRETALDLIAEQTSSERATLEAAFDDSKGFWPETPEITKDGWDKVVAVYPESAGDVEYDDVVAYAGG